MKKPSLLVIFLTVFIDLIGFGIVLPLLPRYSEKFGAEGFMIGAIISSFSLMQFFFAPAWGRLSDRIGRRPVLLISNAGSAISYAMFALAAWPGLSSTTALGILLASRVFAGICGANLSVASAYIADVTPREGRSKGMALIGVSFGLGFILGPALGAISAATMGLSGPGWVAAGLCAGNFVLGCFILVESRQPNSEQASARPKLAQWSHTLSQPKVGLLIGLYFLATFCFACFESTLPLLLGSPAFHPDDFRDPKALAAKFASSADPVSERIRSQLSLDFRRRMVESDGSSTAGLRTAFFHEINRIIRVPTLFDDATIARIPARPATQAMLKEKPSGEASVRLNRLLLEDAYSAEISQQTMYFDEKHIGYLFAYCGLVSTFIQGGVIGRLVKKFGEQKLIFGSLLVVAISMALLPYSPAAHLTGLLVALAFFSAGSGVNRAPTMGLISIYTSSAEQGATMGVAQSAGTLARIFGPVSATTLYAVYPHSPYLLGAAIAFVASFLAWRFLCQDHTPPPSHA